jgi:hypothetical protein
MWWQYRRFLRDDYRSWDIPGSRLLPTDRLAKLQSGPLQAWCERIATSYRTPPTAKPSASSVALTLATWSPWISMVRSLTVPPVLQVVRSFLATFSMMETGRCVAKSYTTTTAFPPRWAVSRRSRTRPIFQTGSLGIGVGEEGFSDKGIFSLSSAGPSPLKGGALAFVSTRSLGFFFTAKELVAERRLALNRFLAGTLERNGWGWCNPIRARFR